VVETASLACEDKESLQYAELCNIAGVCLLELNKLGECRKYMEMCLHLQEKLLLDNDTEVSLSPSLY
jgi:hypothetical protein